LLPASSSHLGKVRPRKAVLRGIPLGQSVERHDIGNTAMDGNNKALYRASTIESAQMPRDPGRPITLLATHQRQFVRYATWRLGHRADAEDVVQSFNLKVLSRAEEAGQPKGLAWLYRVLRTTHIDHYRREATRRRAYYSLAREPQAGKAEPAATPRGCVQRVAPTLRPDQQEQLRRADLGSEPHGRIAASLGTTANTIGVRLHKLAARAACSPARFHVIADQLGGVTAQLICINATKVDVDPNPSYPAYLPISSATQLRRSAFTGSSATAIARLMDQMIRVTGYSGSISSAWFHPVIRLQPQRL
jgi:RNA polymerase sigma-70 factor (ECF subfamily)